MSFAYPFGDVDEAAVTAVREAGFAAAVTCAESLVRPGASPLRLPRLEVRGGTTGFAGLLARWFETA